MDIGRILLLLSFLIFISDAAYCQSTETNSETVYNNDRYAAVFGDEDIAFSEEDYKYTKNENLFFQVWLDQGWTLSILVFWFDHSLFNRWGIYVLLSDPHGNLFRSTLEIKPEDISFKTERLWIKTGDSIFMKSGDEYEIQLDLEDFHCHLTFSNILPTGNPGDDVVYLSDDRKAFQRRIIISPLAKVHGTIAVEGEERTVNGRGYADRITIVNPLNKLNPFFLSLHLYDDEDIDSADQWHVQVLDIRAKKAYGHRRMPRLIVTKGEEYVLQTEDVEIELLDFSIFKHRRQSYPQKVRVFSQSQGYTLEGAYVTRQLYQATDILEETPRWMKLILALFLDMRLNFRCTGEFIGTITLPDGTVQPLHLFGPYEYVIMK